jgi:hypothetical protein
LCYLQGLPRVDAAARMGVSPARMQKLMDGYGAGRPGVAGKVGALIDTIRAGGWCAEQASLMRGLAFGILDPDGERYRLAIAHRRECPACRAYVRSLRGLAAVLPPVPSLLHWSVGGGAVATGGAAVVTHAGAGVRIGAGAHGSAGAGASGGAGAGVGAGSGLGVGGAASASGAVGAGASAAGGGWLLAGGGVGAKLAVGCVLALGIGAGCVALGGDPDGALPVRHEHAAARLRLPDSSAAGGGAAAASIAPSSRGAAVAGLGEPASARGTARAPARATRALREFGPEQVPGEARAASSTSAPTTPAARSAAVGVRPEAASSASGSPSTTRSASSTGRVQPVGVSAAVREFAPG